MLVLQPPASLAPLHDTTAPSLFLAGSIEMDDAPRWQDQLIAALADTDLVILNPRREAWDATWEQRARCEPFREQVEWELEGLERADRVCFYFAPATKSPISLLELGLVARSGRAVVCCPEGFWRRGNVEIVCGRYGIELLEDLDALARHLRGTGGRPKSSGSSVT
ncbi:nucleoside 2-deoxyribosyltransferase domain-containing protein [Paraliomyxa miuraensis]|uniref:nucleoside 2-deoxyribosyltransferase domain-containing protein n=1 Tax=Paraliomyxa miuraensis TaxID=376150 RepID=UPI00225972FD|nr:nucleoside 2-deoxyribosyltransferase domain-containing protein [Paraliomyxa miuraensis]MCX4247915.1 nucleoside 2-deoxyribosyltransferase domain-containing protein [Paraliomyxa miuraensis]